ncbi:MAG: hypothetical protein BMS9Abin05_2071 [Rhodothermia bacterium]|nr:MAG: hypothetical protein BMS9Abin05_2071 [Rhodothermia bacterium]
MVWLTWLGLPALALFFAIHENWFAGALVLVVGIIAQIAYVRWFPWISRWIGYGSVADDRAEPTPMTGKLPRVTLYTANVCPFCPIVRKRLEALRQSLEFELEEVDVTLRPHVARAKGFLSVPVVEANGRFLFGNATSVQLVAFLEGVTDSS